MREVKAIIQPFLAEKVLDALHQIQEMPGITVSEVRGYGKWHDATTSGDEKRIEIFGDKKIKLEAVVPDPLVDQVIATIAREAHTGNPGDGKIFVLPVWDVLKIRTGERGDQAI